MDREIPFDKKEKCDTCGKLGAFDFMGDFICGDCLKPKKKKKKELNANRNPTKKDLP